MAKRPTRLATAAAAVKKNLLGTAAAAPKTVKMPQAVHELHVSLDDVIPAGTIITDEIAEIAELTAEQIEDLIDTGAIQLVDVYAAALAPGDEAAEA